ncbi:MAG: hypothetical protein WAL09_09835 [Pseudolabrys sp.]
MAASISAAAAVSALEKYTSIAHGPCWNGSSIVQMGGISMSKTQKGNKEKKKPKADKDQPKSHVSAYKAAQGQGKPSFNPFARKT